MGLICPLARLLKIDANELLGFREALSDAEAQQQTLEVMNLADAQGLDAAIERARALMRAYPNCGYLAYSLAGLLHGLVSLNADDERREEYQAQLDAWLEVAAECDDPRVRGQACEFLANRYISRNDWAAAERIIDAQPERSGQDKRTMRANLARRQGKHEEAAKLLQSVLLSLANEACTALQMLAESELALGERETSVELTRVLEQAVATFDLWPFIGLAASFQCAVETKNTAEALRTLGQLREALDKPWRPNDSPLYRRISQGRESAMNERIWPLMLADLEGNPDYDFLRGEAEFRALTEAFRARAAKT